ncbi:MAG: DUF2917 domain-containing protein [Bdellovibrionaceae bacterium]|nr:DUF2917 domain-containing protein [Pseudobdellovibrionaceae bacterium]
MNKLKQGHISLKRGEVLKIDSIDKNATLICRSGSVWVTASKDLNDYIVKAGGSINLDGKSQIVLEGLSPELELDIQLCA